MAKVNSARLEARVKLEIYDMLKLAAEMTGRTLTDFVVSSAYEQAKKAIEEHTAITLSLRDQQKFVDSLLVPHEPSDAMKKAMARHQELFG